LKRIFPNLYRFAGVGAMSRTWSYLVVRKDGNLLLPGYVSAITDNLDEIEKLGGVELQFLTHFHDVVPEIHDELHKRFGAKLCHHEAAGPKVRGKSKCPSEEFSNDGIRLGSDFESVNFPGHTPGHTVYRWRDRARTFLFSGHSMKLIFGRWELFFKSRKSDRFDDLCEADHLLPSSSSHGSEEYHSFIEPTRASFREAVDQAKECPNPATRRVQSGWLRS
jgi:glyoxylase-like metal-dependent hydrolase (beta-lactamase superfamily II)